MDRAKAAIGLTCAVGLLGQALPLGAAWPIAWIIPAALLFAVHGRRVAPAAALFGLGIGLHALALGWWIPWTLIRRFGAEPAAAALPWLLGAASHVPAAALLGALASASSGASRAYPLGVGLGWGVMELSWETVWPRLPSWTVLASSQIDTPLAPLAASIGVYGVSAWVAAGSAGCLQLALRGRRGASAACAALLFAGIAAWTTAPRAAPAGASVPARLALVQPGVPMPRAGASAAFEGELLESLLTATRELRARVSWVIWPEGSLLDPPGDRPELIGRIRSAIGTRRFDLVLGGIRRAGRERRVSAFVLEPGRSVRPVYDKRRLVPFAERWPGGLPLALRAHLGHLPPARPPSAGEVDGPPLPFELSLCWESAFSASRGDPLAGTLVNLANDGWYDDTPAAALALLLARWRAIERRAWLVRAASTGISAVVSPDGRLAASLSVGERGALLAPLVRHSPATIFERAGYTPLCLALAVLLTLQVLFSSRVRSGRA